MNEKDTQLANKPHPSQLNDIDLALERLETPAKRCLLEDLEKDVDLRIIRKSNALPHPDNGIPLNYQSQ